MVGSSDMPAANSRRELAAIMFSDIVGYTLVMGHDERAGLCALREHRERLRAVLPKFDGRLIGEIGDGTLSSFHSALDAVNCARELQATLVEDPELRLRIGIHVGDVLFTDNTVLGDGVNIASRLNALATPGSDVSLLGAGASCCPRAIFSNRTSRLSAVDTIREATGCSVLTVPSGSVIGLKALASSTPTRQR